ncbi:MAG TPA: alpha-glucan family phosphorylase [Candidatus Omnitrophota bacterium]|nr:alpha-glucan family phosphorylase [Candidatus Omnitrophota bacterium]
METAPKQTMSYKYDDIAASIERFDPDYKDDITEKQFFGFPLKAVLEDEKRLLNPEIPSVAYFSMEYGLAPSIYNTFSSAHSMGEKNQFFTHEVFSNYWLADYIFKIHIDKMLDIPIYSGGLGVLAGDTIKSAADRGVSFVGLGILWNKGYFKQNFWYKHGQIPEELQWDPDAYPGLVPLKNIVYLDTREGRLALRLWKYYVYSYDKKHVCPLVLLDSNVEGNPEHFKKLTDQLYRSDDVWWKIFQRSILGIGGMKALDSLGYKVDRYHLNEGHAAFALLEKYISLQDKSQMEEHRKKFIFTCHTPVAAGHDRFGVHDLSRVLTQPYIDAAQMFGKENPSSDQVNLTLMSLNNASRMNAVAQKHGEVMRLQFPMFKEKIQAITNGVHLHTWLSESFAKLFDKYDRVFGDWRKDQHNLLKVLELKSDAAFRKDLFEAHQQNKRNMISIIRHWGLREDVFTISWARRIASYKRPALIFQDVKQLVQIAKEQGPLQIVVAGKAHPNDNLGGAHIDKIMDHINELNEYRDDIRVLLLENYDTYFGKLLSNSVDVWLNNPLPPFEASGTSGMKAIMNGVLQCSTLDGWVVEAENDDIGWIFGYRHTGTDLGGEHDARLQEDSKALYEVLRQAVALYYQTYKAGQLNAKSAWIDKMIHCIQRAAFFNTDRMVSQYESEMWKLPS